MSHDTKRTNQALTAQSSIQGSLLLNSKRLQLFAYVLAELSSASTLLEDYTHAAQRIPQRLTATWQTLAVAAAWRTTLDHTIRLYASQKVKRWSRQHIRQHRRRQRAAQRAHEATTTTSAAEHHVSTSDHPLSAPATTTTTASTLALAPQTAPQRRLSSPRTARWSAWPHAPNTEATVDEEAEADKDGGDRTSIAESRVSRRAQMGPRRFPTPTTAKRVLDGASMPIGRRASGYLRRAAGIPLAHTSTASTETTARASPVSSTSGSPTVVTQTTSGATSRDVASPTAAAPQGPSAPHRRRKKDRPFSWTTQAIHSKLARLFTLCTAGEDELGQRIESLREGLVVALFNQFLDVRVRHSANDLVLYRWLDRRRYLTVAEERALEVHVVARAEYVAAQRLIAKQRKKARTWADTESPQYASPPPDSRDDDGDGSGDGCCVNEETDGAPKVTPLTSESSSTYLASANTSVPVAGAMTESNTTTTNNNTNVSDDPGSADPPSSWRSRTRPMLSLPNSTFHSPPPHRGLFGKAEKKRRSADRAAVADGLPQTFLEALERPRGTATAAMTTHPATPKGWDDELAGSTRSSRVSGPLAAPHSPFSYHSAAVAMPDEVYQRASATRDGRRLSGMDLTDYHHPTTPLSASTSPRPRRRRQRSEPHEGALAEDEEEEEVGVASVGSTARTSVVGRSSRIPSQNSLGYDEGLPALARQGSVPQRLRLSPPHVNTGLALSSDKTTPAADGLREPSRRGLSVVSSDTESATPIAASPPLRAAAAASDQPPASPVPLPADPQRRRGLRDGDELLSGVKVECLDEDGAGKDDESDTDTEGTSLLSALLRDAPPPLHLAATTEEKVLLDVVPMPLQIFMRAATSFSPTVCAFSLLSRCVIYASHVRNNEEDGTTEADAAYARFLERERPLEAPARTDPLGSAVDQTSSPSQGQRSPTTGPAPHYFHIVIANREVGHCEHSIPCFGNRKFIFVPCASADALVREDDDEDEDDNILEGDDSVFDSVASDRVMTDAEADPQSCPPPPQRRQRSETQDSADTARPSSCQLIQQSDQSVGGWPAAQFASNSTYETIDESDDDNNNSPRLPRSRDHVQSASPPAPVRVHMRSASPTSSSPLVSSPADGEGDKRDEDGGSVHSPSPNASLHPCLGRHPPHECVTRAAASQVVQDVTSPLVAGQTSFSMPSSYQGGAGHRSGLAGHGSPSVLLGSGGHDASGTSSSLPALRSSSSSGVAGSTMRRGGRRRSAVFPASTTDMRDQLLSLGDRLPASMHSSLEPLPARANTEAFDEEKNDEDDEYEDVQKLEGTATQARAGKDGGDGNDREERVEKVATSTTTTPAKPWPTSGTSALPTATPPSVSSAQRRPPPSPAPATSTGSVSPSLSASRKPWATPLAPPPFMQVTDAAPSSVSAYKLSTAAAARSSTTKTDMPRPNEEATDAPAQATSPDRLPFPAKVWGTHDDNEEEGHVRSPRLGTGLSEGEDDQEAEEEEAEEEEEEEIPFFVMHARYCSAPAESDAMPRPAITAAADAAPPPATSPQEPTHTFTSTKAAVDAGSGKQWASQAEALSSTFASVKQLHDAVGVASTLPTTLPIAMPPPPARPLPTSGALQKRPSNAASSSALVDRAAVALQAFPFPSRQIGDGYWQSTFDNTILMPPDSGQALSFHPRPKHDNVTGALPVEEAAITAAAAAPTPTTTSPTASSCSPLLVPPMASTTRRDGGAHTTAITPLLQDTTPRTRDHEVGTAAATCASREQDLLASSIAPCADTPPSEGDLAFATELIARLQFWCLRGQPRDAYVLNPAYTTTPKAATASEVPVKNADEDDGDGDGADGKKTSDEDGARTDQMPAAMDDADTTTASAKGAFERTLTRPLKLLYSHVGMVCFHESELPPEPSQSATAARRHSHRRRWPQSSTATATTAGGKLGHDGLAVNEEDSASDIADDLDVSSVSCDTDSDMDSQSASSTSTSSASSSSRPDEEEEEEDVPDLTPPTAPTNRRGQELLYNALKEASEVVVCALRECRPHRGYHDLWHVGTTRTGSASASLLKVADTLSDSESDITEFDRCEHLRVDADVAWAQGAMAPTPSSSPSSPQSEDAGLLFPRKTIGTHDRAQWQLERLRNEYRVARSSRVDALLIDSARGKVIAAITLESTVTHSERSRSRTHPQTRSSKTHLNVKPGHAKKDVQHPPIPSDSLLFMPGMCGEKAAATSSAPETTAADTTTTATKGSMERETRFRVISFTPYISPLWRHLHHSKLLLVDMDRTLIDNAITISPSEQRYWLLNERARELQQQQQQQQQEQDKSATGQSLQPLNLLDDFFDRTRVQQRAGHTFHYEERRPITYFMAANASTAAAADPLSAAASSPSSATTAAATTPPDRVVLDYQKPITELICVRPGVRQWLHRTAVQWGIPVVMVTKSSRQRAEAIVRDVFDPRGALLQRYGVQIVSAEQIVRAAAGSGSAKMPTPCASPETFGLSSGAVALTESKKSVVAILRGVFGQGVSCGPHQLAMSALLNSSTTGHTPSSVYTPMGRAAPGAEDSRRARQLIHQFVPRTLARSVAIVDDSPQVWEEADWPCTVLIAPYTLVRVDPRYYLSSDDGYLSSLTVSCLFSTRCLICPQHLDARASAAAASTGAGTLSTTVPRGCHCLCACPLSHRRRVLVAKRLRGAPTSICSPNTATVEEGVAEEASSSASSSPSASRSASGLFGDDVEEVTFPPRRARRDESTVISGGGGGPLDRDSASATAPLAVSPPGATLHGFPPTHHHLSYSGVGGAGPEDAEELESHSGHLMSIPRDELNMSLEAATTPRGNHFLSPPSRADGHASGTGGSSLTAMPPTPNSFTFAVPLAPFPDDLTLASTGEERVGAGAHGGTCGGGGGDGLVRPRYTSIGSGVADDEGDLFTPRRDGENWPMTAGAVFPSGLVEDVGPAEDLGGRTSDWPSLSRATPSQSSQQTPHSHAHAHHHRHTSSSSGGNNAASNTKEDSFRFVPTVQPQRSAWYTDDVEDVVPIACTAASDDDEGDTTGQGTGAVETEAPWEASLTNQQQRPTRSRDDDVEDVVPL